MAKKKKAQSETKAAAGNGYEPRLKRRYAEEIVPKLQKEFGIDNPMAVPRLDKIAINIGLGEASRNFKLLEAAQAERVARSRSAVTTASGPGSSRSGWPRGCATSTPRSCSPRAPGAC